MDMERDVFIVTPHLIQPPCPSTGTLEGLPSNVGLLLCVSWRPLVQVALFALGVTPGLLLSVVMLRSRATSQAIGCTWGNCQCDSFRSGKLKKRQCDNCNHGWVAHALSKLKVHHMHQSSQVEIVHCNVVFDICSLMLFGTQAIPIRLKILLDRLFTVLKQEEVIQILNALDWTLQDYIRGYVLQDVAGKVLDRWVMMTFEEEIATLQQFLRFGETKPIVELMALQDKEGQAVLVPSTCTNSDIRTFIERNTPRITASILPTNANDKVTTNSRHHFENLINNMAFMLPFQLLGSFSAPLQLLGSVSVPLQQQQHQQLPKRCSTSMLLSETKQDDPEQRDLVKSNSLVHPSETSLDSFLSSNPVLLSPNLEQIGNKPTESPSTTPKKEAEDFPPSDSHSERPPTPCTLSISSELTRLSPEGKQSYLNRNTSGNGRVPGSTVGSVSLKKGRVFCTACEKTFYDKGTLKIHYNAVHLKIKYMCTIDGCNMMFSSLRSRNRHSANPNPRLHMPMNRNNRDKDQRVSLSAIDSSQLEKISDNGSCLPISTTDDHKSVPGQGSALFPNLKTVQPVLPFFRSLVTPAEIANTGTVPSLPLLSSAPIKPIVCPKPFLADPLPKKKSRKSSMPIKIETKGDEQNEQMEKSRRSESEPTLNGNYKKKCDACQTDRYTCPIQARQVNEVRGYVIGEKKKESKLEHHLFDRTSGQEFVKTEEKDVPCQAETVVISSRQPSVEHRHLENHHKSKTSYQASEDIENTTNIENVNSHPSATRISDLKHIKGKHGSINGEIRQHSDDGNYDSAADEDDCKDLSMSHLEPNAELPYHCDICKKTFKNPYCVKIHYQNVHLRDVHVCRVDGCNACFPSQRGLDRLHQKLLAKDQCPANTLDSPVMNCRDREFDCLEYEQDKQNIDSSDQRTTAKTTVVFPGHNHMALPINKMFVASYSAGKGESTQDEGEEDGAILDLSTSSSNSLQGNNSAQLIWDSDGAYSEEEDELKVIEDGLPMDYLDKCCNRIGMGVHGEELVLTEGRTPGCSDEGQSKFCGGGSGSPTTCHVCQKVYSNRGTFRAHFKTVHLRLLHKCKVPGCNTSFSSVRSRNRHSQNPNLHKNLAVCSGTTDNQD